jgi:hypothetical protein
MTNNALRRESEWQSATDAPPIHLDALDTVRGEEPHGTETYVAFVPYGMPDGVWIEAHEDDVAELGVWR